MNTRGSGSAAPKVAKKAVDQKAVDQKAGKPKLAESVFKSQDNSDIPAKSLSPKELKAAKNTQKRAPMLEPVVVKHSGASLEESPKRSVFKSTFNTHDIMHAPVEKTIQMLDKILAGERLFTM